MSPDSHIPLYPSMRQVASDLPIVDAARVERARAQVVSRPIEYAFGCRAAEEAALMAGDKPMLQRFVSPDEADRFRAGWAARGFRVELTELAFGRGGPAVGGPPGEDPASAEAGLRLLLGSPPASTAPGTASTANVETKRGPPRRLCAYVSRDDQRLAEALACHAEADEAGLGVLLGYPTCCTAAYAAVPESGRPVRVYRDALQRTQGRAHPRLNNLDAAVFHYISWSPCSFSCEASVAHADRARSHLLADDRTRPHARKFLERIDRALGAHRLVLFDDLQIAIDGVLAGEEVTVERVRAVAQDRHPDVPTDDALREAAARVLAAIEPARTLVVTDDVLYVDGVPLLRTPELVLIPFGAASPA